MVKKIIIGVLGLIVLIAIGVVFLGSNIDSVIKMAIERYGSAATQTEISLKDVRVSASNGEGVIDGFVMGNPEGFASDSAIKIGQAKVKIDPKSLMGKGPIVIDDITIDGPEITYEVASHGESNLQKIQNNVAQFAANVTAPLKEDSTSADKSQAAAQKKNQEARKVIIKNILIRNGKIRLSHELLKGDNALTANLPLIQMSNIGAGSDGASPAIVARDILDRLTSAAISTGQANLVKQLKQQGLDSLKGAAEESEIGKGVTKAINGLFGK